MFENYQKKKNEINAQIKYCHSCDLRYDHSSIKATTHLHIPFNIKII